MGANNIEFRLSSRFEGEGFNKASAAIQQNQKEINSSIRGLGELSNVLGSISPQAATAASSIASFGQAFVAGGIVGGAIRLALDGISFAVDKVSEGFAKAAEETKRYADILKNDVVSALGNATAQFGRLKGEMSESSKQAKDLLSVLNGDVAHEAANKIYQLHIETIHKINDQMSETERAVILAEQSRKEAIIRAKSAEEQAANSIDAYRTALDNSARIKESAAKRSAEAEESLAKITEQTSEYLNKRKQLENYITTEEERFKEGQITLREILVARKNTSLKLNELEEEYKDDVSRLKNATASLDAARKDSEKADYEYVQAQRQLHVAVQKRDEALQAITLAETEGAIRVKDAQNKHAEALEKEAKTHQEALNACGGFIDAWNDFMRLRA